MSDMLELKRRLARLLVEKSYREGDFVLASGRRSDYYFDCRVTALHAEGSWLIGRLFNDLLKDCLCARNPRGTAPISSWKASAISSPAIPWPCSKMW